MNMQSDEPKKKRLLLDKIEFANFKGKEKCHI